MGTLRGITENSASRTVYGSGGSMFTTHIQLYNSFYLTAHM